jgi:hypothetical protein
LTGSPALSSAIRPDSIFTDAGTGIIREMCTG